jgi:lycopene cyclase CruA
VQQETWHAALQSFPQDFSRKFPGTLQAFAGLSDGGAALRHVIELEAGFGAARAPASLARGDIGEVRGDDLYDVVIMGGGLSLIYAATLARAGLRVCVFDRRRIGCGHREWNISRRELRPLTRSGLFDEAEVAALIRREYRSGFCRFGDGPAYSVQGVLDCVVDAEKLQDSLRARTEAASATLLDHHDFLGYRPDRDGVTVALRPTRSSSSERRFVRGRLLLDALGARSPHARFDLCCPTVGGVMEGLTAGSGRAELDPSLGEILVTTEGVEDGQQHIWEGFPAARDGAMTIYLFYYQRADEVAAAVKRGEHPLLSLYERFFTTLPRYKSGALRLCRPTYGYIPAYTRLGPGVPPAAPHDRVFLVGDAAARHSPLTFCGFGSMIRSFWPISQGLLRLLAANRLSRRELAALWSEPPFRRTDGDGNSDGPTVNPPALEVMGGLTLMMMPPPGGALEDPDGINQLLDAAFAVLHGMGEEVYAAFLQDSVDATTFIRFMLGAASAHPAVYRKVFAHLTPAEAATWLLRLLRFRWRASSKQR